MLQGLLFVPVSAISSHLTLRSYGARGLLSFMAHTDEFGVSHLCVNLNPWGEQCEVSTWKVIQGFSDAQSFRIGVASMTTHRGFNDATIQGQWQQHQAQRLKQHKLILKVLGKAQSMLTF